MECWVQILFVSRFVLDHHYEIVGDTVNCARRTHICDTSHRHASVYAGTSRRHAVSTIKVTSLLSGIAPSVSMLIA